MFKWLMNLFKEKEYPFGSGSFYLGGCFTTRNEKKYNEVRMLLHDPSNKEIIDDFAKKANRDLYKFIAKLRRKRGKNV